MFENGTPFQKSVWNYLRTIPRGETRTYKEVAESLGNPKAYRAVASACAKNPDAPNTPCHRVVASNGIGGYSGKDGIPGKIRLLKHEGVDVSKYL